MKKRLKQLSAAYSLKSGPWLIAMLLTISFLPLLLKSVIMLIKQNALPAWLTIMFDLLGWIGAWLMFFITIWKMDGHHRTDFRRGLLASFYRGGLWLIAISLLLDTVYKLFMSYGSILFIKGSALFYQLGNILVLFLICFIIPIFVFWLLCIMADPQYKAPFFRVFGFWLKRPLLVLGSLFCAFLILLAIPLLYDFMLKNLPGLSLSFLELVAGGSFLALFQWLILQPILTVLFQHACRFQSMVNVEKPVSEDEVGKEKAKKPASFIKRQISTLASIIIIVASGVYSLMSGYPISPVSAVKQDIQYYLSYAQLLGKSGDPAAAAYYEKTAEGRVAAWRGAVLNSADAMNMALTLAPVDEQVQLLSVLAASNRLAALEQGFLTGNRSPAWYLALLNEYAKAADLSDIQKQRETELLHICILQGYYTQASVMPADLSSKEDEFSDMLDGFNEQLTAGKYYALEARVGEDGGVTRQLVFDTLDMAEKYDDDINLQYLAMTYGTTFLEDNASHYGRTADAALRYDDLFMKLKAKNVSQDVIITEKLTVAKSLMTCGRINECVDFLSSLKYQSTELSMLKASALFSLKSYDKCLEAVSDLLKQSPDDPQALYLAAICSLQLKDITGSINYAISLAKLVETPGNELQTESLLYPYVLRFTLNDSTGGYNTEAYSTLNEDQTALLKSNEFLYNYMTAAYLWARQNDECRAQAFDLLDKILTVKPNLSRALYMKGAISFELNNKDEALESIKASLALDDNQPTAWYALANIYDEMQKYDEAYAACQKVLEHLPSTDHGSDVFGVSIHARQLMENLKPFIKEGK